MSWRQDVNSRASSYEVTTTSRWMEHGVPRPARMPQQHTCNNKSALQTPGIHPAEKIVGKVVLTCCMLLDNDIYQIIPNYAFQKDI